MLEISHTAYIHNPFTALCQNTTDALELDDHTSSNTTEEAIRFTSMDFVVKVLNFPLDIDNVVLPVTRWLRLTVRRPRGYCFLTCHPQRSMHPVCATIVGRPSIPIRSSSP